MNEQLQIFLDKWEGSRHAQLAKWRLTLARYHKEPGCGLVVDGARRKIEYYEHELRMLQELRARSLP